MSRGSLDHPVVAPAQRDAIRGVGRAAAVADRDEVVCLKLGGLGAADAGAEQRVEPDPLAASPRCLDHGVPELLGGVPAEGLAVLADGLVLAAVGAGRHKRAASEAGT